MSNTSIDGSADNTRKSSVSDPGRPTGNATPARAHRLAAPLVVVFAGWLLYAGPLLNPRTVLHLSDTFCIDVPRRLYAGEMIRQGHFPAWTSKLQCGFPLLGEGQTALLYPFFWIHALVPTAEANDLFVAFHFLLLALFTFLFLEQLVGAWPAVCGSMTLLMSAYVQTNHVIPGTSATLCWLPINLFFIDRWRAGHPRALWWMPLTTALAIFAWEPHTLVATWLIQGLYLVYRCFWGPANSMHPSPPTESWAHRGMLAMKGLVVVFGLAVVVAAAQILPAIDFVGQSSRTEGYTSALSLERFRAARLPVPLFLTFLHPDILGTPWNPRFPMVWEEYMTIFCGFASLVLAPIGLFWGRPRRDVIFWLVLLVLGVDFVTAGPIYSTVLYQLPVFNWLRWPTRYMVLFTLAISVLTAMGAKVLLDAARNRGASALAYRLAVVGVVAGAILGHPRGMAAYLADRDFFEERSKVIVELSRSPDFRLLPVVRPLYESLTASEEILRRNARFLPADYNLAHRVPVACQCGQGETVTQRLIQDLFEVHHPNFLKVAAVSHLSAPRPLEEIRTTHADPLWEVYLPPDSLLERVPDDSAYLYRFKPALGRVRLLYRARVAPERDERLALLGSPGFRPEKEAIVEEPVTIGPEPGTPPTLSWKEAGDSSLEIAVSTQSPALLVIADTYTPAVRATIDGRPARILKTNHAFRGIVVPPGQHVVNMNYSTEGLSKGMMASLVGMTLVGIGLSQSRRNAGY